MYASFDDSFNSVSVSYGKQSTEQIYDQGSKRAFILFSIKYLKCVFHSRFYHIRLLELIYISFHFIFLGQSNFFSPRKHDFALNTCFVFVICKYSFLKRKPSGCKSTGYRGLVPWRCSGRDAMTTTCPSYSQKGKNSWSFIFTERPRQT
jgi:hypothetical protein